MSGPLNEEQRKQVSIIHKSGASLLRLINDVLDLSRIEAGRMNVEKKAMSVRSLVTLVMDTLRPLAEDKRLALREQTAPDVPEFITGDENKLRQILINLVGNGIKFTDRGEVRLSVTYQADPATITFTIADTGIGIPADALEKIFEEFHQADGSSTRKYGGSGLGLTISKRMAELIGGTLTVRSQQDEGSTFTLAVPYVPAGPVPATAVETLRRVRMQVPEPALMSTQDDTVGGILEGKPIVLVAEDEPDTLYIMKKYLNKCGCRVVFARDGTEVLQKAKTYKPIAIVLDLVLPRKTGWDVMSDLKADPETRHIPIVIASVLDNQERGFCMGAYRYLVKPVKETDISDVIHQIQWDERKDIKKVLIIDDSMVDADLLARLLPESRYEVLREKDGLAGIATADREHPDLIILDLALPQLDGFHVLDRLKGRDATRSIPVVIYTAKEVSDSEMLRLRKGAERVLLKNPLEPAKLLKEIADVLKSSPTGLQNFTRHPQGSAGDQPWAADVGGVILPENPSSGRILLVEDDAANQYTLQLMLAAEGYEVQVAENGREALEMVNKWRPELVLMDMMMPVMGGHEATKALKSNEDVTDIPVIALTAAAMAGDREKALASGCDDYISKPVSRLHLLERIEHWLTQSKP
jgi:CheY-like chemotaxis protein/two-component sensor histidine kinase